MARAGSWPLLAGAAVDRLLDLLSNRSGMRCNDHDPASPGNENKLYETNDWVKAFVDLPVTADPGTEA